MRCADCPYTGGERFECCLDAEERRRRADAEALVARRYQQAQLRGGPRLGRSGVLGLALAGTLLESGKGPI